jgi:TPR repeat protein
LDGTASDAKERMNPSRSLCNLLLWAAALLFVPSLRADERPWVEVTTPNFVVISNSGEKDARDVAWQFEQVRSVFKTLWPWARTQSGRKFVVLAVRNAVTLKSLAPKYWEEKGLKPAAVSVSGRAKDYVAIQTDVAEPSNEGENPYYMAYWGYADVVLRATYSRDVPLWYRTGMSELFANTVVRKSDVHVGRIVAWHMRRLQSGTVPLLKDFMAVTRASRDYQDLDRRGSYDAEAWVFLHYLVFGEKGARRAQLNRFSSLLESGTDADVALKEAFGDPGEIEKGFRYYLSQRLFQYAMIPLDLNVKREAFPTRLLSPAAAAAAQAGFHAAMRRPVEARALVAQAKHSDPSLAAAYEVEGLLLDAEEKSDEAQAAFAKAAELGSDSYHVHWRLGHLLWRTAQPDRAAYTRIAAAFEKAAALNPDDAWSHSNLAQARLNADRTAKVLPSARRAVELAPGESYHRQVLARVLHAAGDGPAATTEARRAVSLASDERSRASAQEFLDFLAADAQARQASGAGGTTGAQSPGTVDAPGEGVHKIAFPCEKTDSEGCKSWARQAAEACAQGVDTACVASAWTLENGAGVTKDVNTALALYEKTCTAGVAQGCTGLAVLRLNKNPGKPAAVRSLLEKGCTGGDPEACRFLKSLPK